MTFSKISKSIAALTLVAGMAISAGASANPAKTGLRAWAADAGAAVDDVMVYPAFIRGSGNGTAVFKVTVDSNGDVVKSKQVGRLSNRILNLAARRVIKEADFPAIPDSSDRETLTFELQLSYMVGTPSARYQRPSSVSSEQIAKNQGPAQIALRILPATAD